MFLVLYRTGYSRPCIYADTEKPSIGQRSTHEGCAATRGHGLGADEWRAGDFRVFKVGILEHGTAAKSAGSTGVSSAHDPSLFGAGFVPQILRANPIQKKFRPHGMIGCRSARRGPGNPLKTAIFERSCRSCVRPRSRCFNPVDFREQSGLNFATFDQNAAVEIAINQADKVDAAEVRSQQKLQLCDRFPTGSSRSRAE